MKNKSNPQSLHQFKEFVEECSPQQAAQIERRWRKQKNNQKDQCYTKIMIIAVVAMVFIFVLLINVLTKEKPDKHFQIQQVTYKNVKYSYLQSSYPHLKFLIPPEDTKEIRILKSVGIIYPQLISWIQGNVRPCMKILFVPSEDSMVNVLGITLGYYLKQSKGGQLTIAVSGIMFSQMTQKNIELMNQGLPQKMPIKLLFVNQYKGGQYDLILLENRAFHTKIDQLVSSKIIMIRRQGIQTTIMNSVFLGHSKYEIVRGQSNADIRSFPYLYGYQIIPYVAAQKTELNIILLLPEPIGDLQLCQQQQISFLSNPQIRNLVQNLKNQTFTNTSLYYGIQNKAALEKISKFAGLKLLFTNLKQTATNSTYVNSPNQMIKSAINIQIITASSINSLIMGQKDIIYVYVTNEEEKRSVTNKFSKQNYQSSVLSPFNNKGCYYPPSVADFSKDTSIKYPYFVIIRPKQVPSPQN